jgi:hypothetical protein
VKRFGTPNILRSALRLIVMGVPLLLSQGCAYRLALPSGATATAPIPPDYASVARANEQWGRVLARFVDEPGRIDFAGVSREPADLDAYVVYVAQVSPESAPELFASRESRLAYYINAYNALAMYNAIHSPWQPVDKVRFFFSTKVTIGGEQMSLYSLENRIVRPMGEPRVHFALNCMVRGCPRLAQKPFSAMSLGQELDREARRFLNEERNVQLVAAQRVVRLSSIMKFYAKDFLAQKPSLIAYVNAYRESEIPADFEVRFIPYDWTLNRQ